MPLSAVLLFEDEIILRSFPVLRRAWSPSGQAATVGITGENAKRVVFGCINPRTGHRIVACYPNMRQTGFQEFLRLLRRRYGSRQIWIVLDKASAHIAPASQRLAEALDIVLVWLPKQCPELNAMDHLFKEVKSDISANYQYADVDEHASYAEDYMLGLTNKHALTIAGILSKNFWLKHFL